MGSPPIALVFTHPLPRDRVSKQFDHILAFHTTALKTFGPGNEGALGAKKPGHFPDGFHEGAAPPLPVSGPTLPHLVQARLVTWEGEVEAKLQALTAHRELVQELRQAASSEVKELRDMGCMCDGGAQLCLLEPPLPCWVPEPWQ